MSMSTHVIGFVPPDDRWKAMKAVYDSATAAKVPVPDEVREFFGYDDPDPAGVSIELPVRDWNDDERAREGYEIDVADIPPHVKTIRFYNSW